MKKTFKYTAAALMLAGAFGISGQAQAVSIGIDNFSELAPPNHIDITDDGGDVVGIVGPANALTTTSTSTALTNVVRTVTVTAGGDVNAAENVRINRNSSGVLAVANQGGSDGTVNVHYSFDNHDFIADGATAILLDVMGVDTGVSVQMIVNGDAFTAFQPFTGPGQFYSLFSSFSGGTETGLVNFSHVTELELVFSGVADWDGTFDNLHADVPPVNAPEPAGLALMGLGLAGFAAARKKKQA